MSDARTAILDRIAGAVRTGRIPVAADAHHELPHRSRRANGVAATERSDNDQNRSVLALRERFVAEARALGIETFVEATAEAVRDRLVTIIGNGRVLSWNPDQLPYGSGALIPGAVFGSGARHDLAAAEFGLTGCHGAIAETGSLALISRPGCTRTASLLPPVHVALVQPVDLFFGMSEFFAARADRIAAASNLTFITGPSRTADIELSLTIGVHGPARVVVIFGP